MRRTIFPSGQNELIKRQVNVHFGEGKTWLKLSPLGGAGDTNNSLGGARAAKTAPTPKKFRHLKQLSVCQRGDSWSRLLAFAVCVYGRVSICIGARELNIMEKEQQWSVMVGVACGWRAAKLGASNQKNSPSQLQPRAPNQSISRYRAGEKLDESK